MTIVSTSFKRKFVQQYQTLQFLRFETRVKTTALFGLAELELIRVARDAAAIPFVVSTPAIVVASVTNTIASPVRVATRAAAHLLARCVVFIFGVQTLAVFAVRKLVFMVGNAAAVTSIPSTTAVVVIVVADFITFETSASTFC